MLIYKNMFKLFHFLKRLFEPALKHKATTFKTMFEGFWAYIWWNLIPIISIPIFIDYINSADYSGIKRFALFITIVYIFVWAIHFMIMKWETTGKYVYSLYVNGKYLKKVILKDGVSVEKLGTGKVQSIIKSGMDSWVYINNHIVYWMTRVVLGVATGIYLILKFDKKYIPYFILILIISFSGNYVFRKIRLRYDNKLNDLDNDINKDYVRMIMSKQEIVLNTNVNKEVSNIANTIRNKLYIDRQAAKYGLLDDLSVSGIVCLLPFLGVFFFVNSIELTPINISFLISFIYFSTRFMETMFNFTWVVGEIFTSYPKIKALWGFMDNTPDMIGYHDGKKFEFKNGDIELKDINFSYENKEILKNFNLKIEGKQKVALIGRSGSGKTTIVKLISVFMRPNSGQILIDNQDLSEIALKSFYKNIGYLTQEPMVFDASVKDNLLYSLDDKELKYINDAKLFEVLKAAECDFITDLSVQIGEKGIRLSGGERQRLAIAKLMLKNPEIIILDEPTSALDSFSEDAITRALDRLFKDKTVIIIAHRLQTVRKADKIYVLEKGKIIEEGNHQDLKEKEGHYKKMLDLQTGEE